MSNILPFPPRDMKSCKDALKAAESALGDSPTEDNLAAVRRAQKRLAVKEWQEKADNLVWVPNASGYCVGRDIRDMSDRELADTLSAIRDAKDAQQSRALMNAFAVIGSLPYPA